MENNSVTIPIDQYNELVRGIERTSILARFVADNKYNSLDNDTILMILGVQLMRKEEE